MTNLSGLKELKNEELVKINGGFNSAGEVFGYYLRKASRILDLSRTGFMEVFQRRTYYF